MATAASTRLSGPVLSIPNYGSASPNRVNLTSARSPAKSVSFSSPPASPTATKGRRSCMCSPTNHPGSFRCSRHKERKQEVPAGHGHSTPAPGGHGHSKPASPPSPPQPAAVSTGSGAGAGSRMLVRRALAPPSQSPHQRRVVGEFRPRPRTSRLSTVSLAGDRAGDYRQ